VTLTKLVEQTGATPAATTDNANQTQVAILAVPRRLVAQIDHVIPPDAERQFAQRNARRHDRGRERARRDDLSPAGDTRADRGPADRRRVAVVQAACGSACWRRDPTPASPGGIAAQHHAPRILRLCHRSRPWPDLSHRPTADDANHGASALHAEPNGLSAPAAHSRCRTQHRDSTPHAPTSTNAGVRHEH